MQRKLLAALGGAAVGIHLIAYFASPLFALQNLGSALRRADRDALEEAIDFPSVRESLKAQFNAQIVKAVDDPEMSQNPFSGLAVIMAPAIVGRMLDAVVTPEGIAALVERGRVEAGGPRSEAPKRPVSSPKFYGLRYVNLNRFNAEGAQPADGRDPVALTLERHGFYSWKLTRIGLPGPEAASPAPMQQEQIPVPVATPDTGAQAVAAAEDTQYSPEHERCQNAAEGVTAAVIDCDRLEGDKQDDRLNTNYKKLMSTLDVEEQSNLRSIQRLWIKERDSKCNRRAQEDGGSLAGITYNGCILEMTAIRASELERKLSGEDY